MIDWVLALYGVSSALLAVLAHAVARHESCDCTHRRAVLVWLVPIIVGVVSIVVRSDRELRHDFMVVYLPLLLGVAVSAMYSGGLCVSALAKGERAFGLVALGGAFLSGFGVLPLMMNVPLA